MYLAPISGGQGKAALSQVSVLFFKNCLYVTSLLASDRDN